LSPAEPKGKGTRRRRKKREGEEKKLLRVLNLVGEGG